MTPRGIVARQRQTDRLAQKLTTIRARAGEPAPPPSDPRTLAVRQAQADRDYLQHRVSMLATELLETSRNPIVDRAVQAHARTIGLRLFRLLDESRGV